MPLHLSIVADVFIYEAQAKHALEALRQAGFDYDQIGVAMRGHEGIDLQSDLQNLGVPYEQANYYAQQVKAGHTVVSVRPDGREQEAHEIMLRSGAFTKTDGDESQTHDIDKQKAAWEQAIASHQAYLAEQLAAKKQEDFHQPRSLKPRKERLSVDIQHAQPEATTLITNQKSSIAPLVQQDEVTERKSTVTPIVQNDEATEPFPLAEEQKMSDAQVVQNDTVRELFPLAAEEQLDTVSIDDEETTKRLRKSAQDSAKVFLLQTQREEPESRNRVRNGVLLGGLLLGLATSVVVALLRREQIRQFVLSSTRKMNLLHE
jgi:hypothetical protein